VGRSIYLLAEYDPFSRYAMIAQMNSIQKTKKLWMIGTILVILFVSSNTINSLTLPLSMPIQTLKATPEVDNKENEEIVYLKIRIPSRAV
jgi:hypothetical protein